MYHVSLVLLVLVGYVQAAQQYTAGVVQHYPIKKATPQLTLDANYAAYNAYAAEAAMFGADIILFPEAAVGWFWWKWHRNNTLVFCEEFPDVFNGVPHNVACDNPDVDQTSQLARGSCMAKKHGLIVSLNTCEKKKCTYGKDHFCREDGWFFFNTEVAWDKDGSFKAKYHKTHIFSTNIVYDQPRYPDVVYFDTKIGVRFGIIICWDFEFVEPMRQLLRDHNVTDILFSTGWDNSFPLESAVPLQQGVSRAQGINFLASNNGQAPNKDGGGVYSNGVPLNYYFTTNTTGVRKLLMANVTTPPPPLPPPTSAALSRRAEIEAEIDMAIPVTSVVTPINCNVTKTGHCMAFDITKLTPGNVYTVSTPKVNGLSCTVNFKYSGIVPGEHTIWTLAADNGNHTYPATTSWHIQQLCEWVSCPFPSIGVDENGNKQYNCAYAPPHPGIEAIMSTRFDWVQVIGEEFNATANFMPQFAINGCEPMDPSAVMIEQTTSKQMPGNTAITATSVLPNLGDYPLCTFGWYNYPTIRYPQLMNMGKKDGH